jgi:hypothetical protein
MPTTDNTLCGARRPGWERPGPGSHRLPCVRDIGHDEAHLDAFGETWPRSCDDCGTLESPLESPLESMTVTDTDGTVWDGHLCRPYEGTATAPEPVVDEDQAESAHEKILEPNVLPTVRRPVRMCVRCERITTAPVVVSEVHQNSGPGFAVYACPDCAPHFPPVPDVLHLLTPGWRNRAGDGH